MIVRTRTTNVNMDVAAEKPGERKWLEVFVLVLCDVCPTLTACRGSPCLTRANSEEEKKPEEAENRSSHHLVHSPRMNLLVQFCWQISIVHVVPVCKVLQQHVHQACAEGADKTVIAVNPIKSSDKLWH